MTARIQALSPWAEIDPLHFSGISDRLDTLEGKTLGLLRNSKRAAGPILEILEEKLKKRYPGIRFTEFANLTPNETIMEQELKHEFERWIVDVDAVISAFGD